MFLEEIRPTHEIRENSRKVTFGLHYANQFLERYERTTAGVTQFALCHEQLKFKASDINSFDLAENSRILEEQVSTE